MFIDRGGTVVLGGNIDLGENSVYVNVGVTVTLDLNGYELTTTTYNVIYNYGTLILIDSSENGTGKIVAQDDEVYNGGVLTVTGGTFGHNPLKYLDTDAYHSEKNADGTYTVKAGATVIDTHEELQLFIDRGGTVVLEGNVDMGENYIKNSEGMTVILDLNGYELTSTMFYAIDNPGNLTVIDSSENGTGKITGADYGVYNGGVLTVTGGTFIGKYRGVYSTNDQFTVTGGTFSNDPTEYVDTNVYQVVENADGTYTVKAGAVVLDTYEKLSAAIEAGGTVVLGGNIDLGQNPIRIMEGVTVTLDLNGYELTATILYAIYNDGNLTVIDSSENGTGKVTGQECAIHNEGTLTVTGGTFIGTVRGVSSSNDQVAVTGGTFSYDPMQYLDTDLYEAIQNQDTTYTVTAKNA